MIRELMLIGVGIVVVGMLIVTLLAKVALAAGM
jgi:hypothetical protein